MARLYRILHGDHATPIRRTRDRLGRGHAILEMTSADTTHAVPRARCDRRMEMRAAFLGCGSLAEPSHGYHLEFAPPAPEAAERLAAVMRADGHEPLRATRRGRPLLYFKDIDAIVRLLSSIGAYGAVLHLEGLRALKETKNRIHRLVNTEAANVERAAGAAARQRDAIAALAERRGLGELSAPLREIAELRLRHPAETLAELGRRCRPPVGKSTVNSRLGALLRRASVSGSAANRT